MSTTITGQVFATGQERPLEGLSRRELFMYLEADPSEKAQWDASQEIIHRTAHHTDLAARCRAQHEVLEHAKRLVERAEKKIEASKDSNDQRVVDAAMGELMIAQDLQKARSKEMARLKKLLDAEKLNPKAISTTDVRFYFRDREQPNWIELQRRWEGGGLFRCQSFGWASFLKCSKEDADTDRQTWREVEGTAFLAGEDSSKLYHQMRDMYLIRIAPPLSGTKGRNRFMDSLGNFTSPEDMVDENRSAYWTEWYNYNLATVNHGWQDDSGVAYDPQTFDPKKKGGRG